MYKYARILAMGTEPDTGNTVVEVGFWPDQAAYEAASGNAPLYQTFRKKIAKTAAAPVRDASGKMLTIDGEALTKKEIVKRRLRGDPVRMQLATVEVDPAVAITRVVARFMSRPRNHERTGDERDRRLAFDAKLDPDGVLAHPNVMGLRSRGLVVQ